MPRSRTPPWREREDRIVKRYGMLINTAQLGECIGKKNYDQIKRWAEEENLTPRRIGPRVKWDAMEVAKAIENSAFRV